MMRQAQVLFKAEASWRCFQEVHCFVQTGLCTQRKEIGEPLLVVCKLWETTSRARAQKGDGQHPCKIPSGTRQMVGCRAVYNTPGLGLLGACFGKSLVNQGQQRVSLWNKSLPKDGTSSKSKCMICPQVGIIFPPKLKGVNFLKDKKVSCRLKHSIFSNPVASAESALSPSWIPQVESAWWTISSKNGPRKKKKWPLLVQLPFPLSAFMDLLLNSIGSADTDWPWLHGKGRQHLIQPLGTKIA